MGPGRRLSTFTPPPQEGRRATLTARLIDLDDVLRVGMQVMEDSLCNWQKSPTTFIHFKG
ncbi:alpha-glutamyl/putrescinyl thymine pyrophosphorylase clade 3 protein [Roseicella aerolata]|uniref:Alpha-glutamyl/putrescinyl thymine pyrophosphorylase clade 3 domain-containing protein n=1 Tax=Roseicella aerolata TaxID=2883479 RepID=A0A9X1IJ30_9PROT|nr:hypothetical protein [Roseicella aerolata]